ncbi:MAG: glycosyltransferase [Vicinamibacterales bacterium]
MTTEPGVSVVIPVYNRSRLLPDAIESVLGQSMSDFEVIVVDDGSAEDIASVVRPYRDRVRLVRTEHGGVAHARNVGMRLARGRYLTCLDSDDRLYPYALDLQVRLLERFPAAAFVCAEMSGFDDHGFFERYHLQRYHRSAYRHPQLTYDRMFSTSLVLSDAVTVPARLLADEPTAASRRVYLGNIFDTYLLHLVICQNSVLMRREAALEAGDRNPRVRHWQEVDYLLRITRRHDVCFVDVPTYQLRYHDDQESSATGTARAYRWMRKQQILLRVVRRHALADAAYYRAHRRPIDRRLAHLHRAAAVPMLLQPDAAAGRRYVACAARHIRRAAAYGHPAPALALAALMPAPLRQVLVRTIESLRQWRWRALARLHAGQAVFA